MRTIFAALIFIPSIVAASRVNGAGENASTIIKPDADTIVVDIDQPLKDVYKAELLASIKIGAKPGEISLGPSGESFPIDHAFQVDSAHNAVFIDDGYNHRIEEFRLHPFQFRRVAFQYPDKYEVSGIITLDVIGNMFVGFRLRDKPTQTAGVWEISDGKAIRTFADRMNTSLLGDGQVWFTQPIGRRLSATMYSSLDGKQQFVDDPSAAETRWPLSNGRTLLVINSAPIEKQIVIIDANGTEEKRFDFKSKYRIGGFRVHFGRDSVSFFSFGLMAKEVGLMGREVLCKLNLDDASLSLFGITADIGLTAFDPIATDGDIYFYRSKESASDLTFRIMRAVVVKK